MSSLPPASGTVYAMRRYAVRDVGQAKAIASRYLAGVGLTELAGSFGLPEVDDRYHVWRVPVVGANGDRLGEVVIDAYTSLVQSGCSTDAEVIRERRQQPRKNCPKAGRPPSAARSATTSTRRAVGACAKPSNSETSKRRRRSPSSASR